MLFQFSRLPEIVQDVYSNFPLSRYRNTLVTLKDSQEACKDTNSENFDSSIGEIINIIVSYDMGWSKRGKRMVKATIV